MSAKSAQPRTSSPLSTYSPTQPARLADAELRRDLEQVGVLEAGHARAQEAQVVDRLAPALDLAAESERASVPSTARAVGVLQLGDVDAPLAGVLLRPDDRAAAREAELAGRLGRVHQRGNRPPRLAGARVVDVADAKHQRREEQRAAVLCIGTPAKWARSPSPEQSMKVAARIAKRPDLVSTRSASMRPLVARDDADREGMEQQLGAGAEQHRVGGALERRGVVRLRQDLAEDEMRLVQAVERAHALEQLVGDAVHDAPDRAVHVGVQAAEVGDAGGRAHAAEEAVALDQQRARAAPRRRGRRRDAGRPAAEDDDVVFAEDRRPSRRLGDRRRRRLTSVQRDVVLLDDRPPALDVGGEPGARLGRRVGDDVHVLQLELLAHLRVGEDLRPARRAAS